MSDTEEKPVVVGPVGGFAKVDKFDGQGSVERFLDHFDVVAEANGWTPEVQTLQLPTALCGHAVDFFRRLSADEKASVVALKAALRKEYSTIALESDYALFFVSRRRQPEEPLPEFGEALKTSARKAYPSFNDDQIESLCKTHFINGGLSDTLRAQLLLGGSPTESFRDLIARARRLEQVFAPHAAVRRVPMEDDALRSEVQRLTSVVSSLEQKVEALSLAPRAQRRWQERRRPDRGSQVATATSAEGGAQGLDRGHLKSAEAGAPRRPICFRCKQPGHLARGCANFE